MTTTYGELIRKVSLRVKRSDGLGNLAVREGINDAQKVIACIKDFDELMTLDTTHALTVISKKLYHIEIDLALVRPKDIYTIRYMDEENSRKLEYVSLQDLDRRIPYTEQLATGKPTFYTRRGMYIELIRIPDEVKYLYIQHSQWPLILSADSDQTSYLNLDHVIIALATDMALTILEGGSGDWVSRAQHLLGVSLSEDAIRPDIWHIAKPFESVVSFPIGEYWKNPWIKHQPE